MKFLLFLGFLLFRQAAWANSYTKLPSVNVRVDNSVIALLLKSQTYRTKTDTGQSATCFNLYLPHINEVASAYAAQYEQCTTTAAEQYSNLTAALVQNETDFVESMNNTCTIFQNCLAVSQGQHADMVDDDAEVLGCYTTASTEFQMNVLQEQAPSNVMSTAKRLITELTEIKTAEWRCTSSAEQFYVTNTAAAYLKLENCLQYGPNSNEYAEVTPK